jgi:1-deoxy-D-xylulose 5-phosphate reductoisomerase
VAAFLEGTLPFLGIPDVVERTLARVDPAPAGSLDEFVAVDVDARRIAAGLTRELVH